ncbi:MAG TPA: hypothetical protein VK635_22465 [Bradyrhizobium sp.]|nr:hypothetical protein [Bradyrhizobium sp.]
MSDQAADENDVSWILFFQTCIKMMMAIRRPGAKGEGELGVLAELGQSAASRDMLSWHASPSSC